MVVTLAATAAAWSDPGGAANAGTWSSQQRLARHEGRIQAVNGHPAKLLVIYHYFEHPAVCPADEEMQLIRANLLYFLR